MRLTPVGTPGRAGRAPATRWMAVVTGLLVAGGCGGDGPEEPDGVPTSVTGVVVRPDQSPVAGVWVHLVHGATGLQVSAGVDATNAGGDYTVRGFVPEGRCHTVRVVVLESSSFSAALTAQADSLVGACGTSEVDIALPAEGPVDGG